MSVIPWKATSTRKGQDGEKFVAAYLTEKGLTHLASNYQSRQGEIDLIFQHKELIIFVEVRLRSNKQFASGAESVDRKKQQRLTACAEHYLQKHFGNRPPPCRFDVVSLSKSKDNRSGYQLEWYEDAFGAGY